MPSPHTFEGRLPSGPQLGTLPDFAKLWGYLKKLLVTEPLGLDAVLRIIRSWIDCDALLLMSRSPSPVSTDGGKCKWTKRASEMSEGVVLRYTALAEHAKFLELVETMMAQAKAGAREKAVAINDWQAPWMTPRGRWDVAMQKIDSWPELKQGFPALARVCIGLLGHTVIGKESLGESVLVAVNERKDNRGGGDLSAARMDLGFLAFCVYLAEVNSHYHRKKRLDDAAPRLRQSILHDTEEQQAYVRSVCRLGPLLGQEDIGLTARTLAQIEKIQRDAAPDPTSYTVEDAHAALRGSAYATAAEPASEPEAQERESLRRKAALDAMQRWARLEWHCRGMVRRAV